MQNAVRNRRFVRQCSGISKPSGELGGFFWIAAKGYTCVRSAAYVLGVEQVGYRTVEDAPLDRRDENHRRGRQE